MIDKVVSYSQLKLLKKSQTPPKYGLSNNCMHRDDENKIRVNANRKMYFCGGNVLYKRLMGNL